MRVCVSCCEKEKGLSGELSRKVHPSPSLELESDLFKADARVKRPYGIAAISLSLQFALPSLWPYYSDFIWPRLGPWLLPFMHVVVMSSVYSTVFIR